ncbi:hypothetical protein NDU88_005166 [Pleurodeles waltl]|uniref:Uncharacterized protein n=1 Tax=Pleurodeles waltl TaxID=8319 RepID=A0AAV7UHA5_PLEWA|nr:hypothetical protein NDU88_005166 [Pleurodeles waltl]
MQPCELLPHTYLDHLPVLLEVEVRSLPPPSFPWRIPPYSLMSAAFRDELVQAIDEYFTIRDRKHPGVMLAVLLHPCKEEDTILGREGVDFALSATGFREVLPKLCSVV